MKYKFLLLEKEMIFILVISAIVLLGFTFLSLYLWNFFRKGFIIIVSFLIMFILRKTEIWKMGIDFFYFIFFLLTYVYGIFIAAPLLILLLYLTYRSRPDEVNALVGHAIVLIGLLISTNYFAKLYGPGIAIGLFFWLAYGLYLFWSWAEFFIAWKICPVPFTYLMITHTIGTLLNYFIISTFGFKLFQYMYAFT